LKRGIDLSDVRSLERGVYTASIDDPSRTRADLERGGWRVFVLPSDIASADSFWEAVRQNIPLEPMLPMLRSLDGRKPHWDAFLDSVKGGLHELESERVAIVWPHSRRLKWRAPRTWRDARKVFGWMVEDLWEGPVRMGGPPTTAIVLLG
jgi:hypothetical protein